jgi:hypothetical protein
VEGSAGFLQEQDRLLANRNHPHERKVNAITRYGQTSPIRRLLLILLYEVLFSFLGKNFVLITI